MKKIRLLLITFLSILIIPGIVNAASGTIKVTSTSTVVVGNKVTVTVTLSSGTSIGSWEMNLNYDKKYLQLTSATSEAGGTIMANSSSGTKSKKYTYTFKTLKTGSTKVTVGSHLVYAYADMSEMNISVSSKTIKVITQEELEASYSKDNNLKSLSVEGFEINPAFNKDTLEYSVTVPEGTKEVKINALTSDSKSSVTGVGLLEVSEGTNNASIVVKAENGSEKTYSLVINVIDQNPINVTIDGKNYTVTKIRENYTCPELFEENTVVINEIEIPSCINENIGYILVGLKNETGTVTSYRYNNGIYEKYVELVGTSIKLINEKYDKEIENLEETTLDIDGIKYQAFSFSKSSKYYVVYGMNVENGDKGLYVYDSVNKTFSGYNTELIEYLEKQNELYLYVIIAFGIGLFLSLICIILLSKKKKKTKNTNKEDQKENIKDIKKDEDKNIKKEPKKIEDKKENDNDIKEINNEEEKTETYYLFESDKLKNKRKRK